MKIPNRCFIYFNFFFIPIIIFSCNKSEESSDAPEAAGNNSFAKQVSFTGVYNFENGEYGSYSFERIPVLHTISLSNETLPSLPFSTSAHSRYLNDPLTFKDIPDGGIPNGPTAVVGSDECLFYPINSISSSKDLTNLPRGETIPFATIIRLGDKLECRDSDKDNMFEFQDNLNFFYKATWNGKQGIVFGADLYGIDKPDVENRINALLYKGNGHFDNFYPVTGYDEIKTGIQRELETNGIAFQEVRQSEYHLGMPSSPDDMISLYQWTDKYVTPVFVTTDLAAHANHLVFDRMFQYLEENYFFPQLIRLTNEYIKSVEDQKGKIPEEVYTTALLYFQTAHALLALAPKKVEGTDYYKTVVYQDVNASQVLGNYPKQVAEEIEKMDKARGLESSSIFNFQTAPKVSVSEDYSQYKPRGHYTKNGVLAAYFRALMWYGRINFNLGDEGGNTKDHAMHLAPIALFIADITENSSEIKKIWQSLFDPITELIGASDDINFYELIPLWNKIKGAGFAQWYSDPKKLDAFVTRESLELRSPAISGSSLFYGVSLPDEGKKVLGGNSAGGNAPEERTPPKGWRLFGQRYTLDSEIHHHVSPPRLLYRDMVRGLDILKVFGSKTADRLLRESDYANPATPTLEKTLNQLQQNMANLKDDYWLSTYYTNILYQIKTLALFENGAGFYFTENPGWNLKAMNAAHGTWAELRHDTILYVKQSSAENAGGGWYPTYRTKPLPEPIHYIEPNIPFWIVSAMGMQKIYTILKKYDCLDGRTAQVLAGMHEIFVKAAEISRLEADDKEVSRSDLNWIRGISNALASLVMTHEGNGGWVDDRDTLRMALVADVFTNFEMQFVLETAVGIPYRLYIPLNDKQGGKRIAIGYGFSYYEFTQPMSNRLTNEEWKAIVYKDNPDMGKYLPFWMQGKVQAAK